MVFKLEVLVEPKDGTYCGECNRLEPHESSTGSPYCYAFGYYTGTGEIGPTRVHACIAAEQAAKESK
jgi:hypothetical protein